MRRQKLWIVLLILHSRVRRVVEWIWCMSCHFASATLISVQNWNPYHSLVASLSQTGGFHFGSQLPFPLVPSVLEPYLNLCLCQMKLCCQTGTFRRRKIPLHFESRLQLINLTSREHCPCFLLPAFLVDIFLVTLWGSIVFFQGICKRQEVSIFVWWIESMVHLGSSTITQLLLLYITPFTTQ